MKENFKEMLILKYFFDVSAWKIIIKKWNSPEN